MSEYGRTVSQYLSPPDDLHSFMCGETDHYIIENSSEYKQYRNYMHDALCIIHKQMEGFVSYEDEADKARKFMEDQFIINQTPDLIKMEGNVIHIKEVTITNNRDLATNKKMERYDYLVKELKKKVEVVFSISALPYMDPDWSNLPEFSFMNDDQVEFMDRLIINLVRIHATEFGMRALRDETFHDIDIREVVKKFDVGLKLEKLAEVTETKVTKEVKHLMAGGFFVDSFSKGLEEHESAYLDFIVDGGFKNFANRPNYFQKKPSQDRFQEQAKIFIRDQNRMTMEKCDPRKSKSVLPFPVPTRINFKDLKPTEWEAAFKEIKETTILTQMIQASFDLSENEFSTMEMSEVIEISEDIKAMMEESKEEFMIPEQLILNRCGSKIFKIRKTDIIKDYFISKGSGRKAAQKSGNVVKEEKKAHSVIIEDGVEDEFSELVKKINNIEFKNVEKLNLTDEDAESCGQFWKSTVNEYLGMYNDDNHIGLLKYMSRVSKEILINGCRRRKSSEVALFHSGIEDLFIMIMPGSQLRTGTGTIFLTFIGLNGLRFIDHPWTKKPDYVTADVTERSGISMDLDRLNWLQRADDRVFLSHFSIMESTYKKNGFDHLIDQIEEELKLDSLPILAYLFLENRMVTSQFMQLSRYFFIKALGDRDMLGLWSKMPSRIVSSLHSLLLQRLLSSITKLMSVPPTKILTLNKLELNLEGHLDDEKGGVKGTLPRLFSSGPPVSVDFIINEIYYCMYYEKDRQYGVRDEMGILNKILKEESKLWEELNRRNSNAGFNHLFGIHTQREDLNQIMMKARGKGESHYYSMPAATIGSKLQRFDESNRGPAGQWYSKYRINNLLTQPIEKFATFKASVKTICKKLTLKELKIIGMKDRTKCIDNVLILLEKDAIFNVQDLLNSISDDFEIAIQIFKKNQIGGVREIIILEIKARILINLLEEIARTIATTDERELLTKGKDKKQLLKEDYLRLINKSQKGRKISFVYNSYDCTTWAQKFIPTIFLSIYRTECKLEPLKNLIQFILLAHTMKEMEFPKGLIEKWVEYPDKKYEERHLQFYKEKFLKDLSPIFLNISNMCQGILHYNSTVLATMKLSLRDEIFRRWCVKNNQEPEINFISRVGSDDHGDMISYYPDSRNGPMQILALEQSLFIAETLLSIDLSVKSASNKFVYEVNQCYLFNGEAISPIIKYAHTAVMPFYTDTVTSYVNQSFTSIRQLRENGGSSILCMIAHCLNKNYMDLIFKTSRGGLNDPTKIFGISKDCIPYDFGVYPLYDMNLHELMGPEFYNYMINRKKKTKTKKLLGVLYSLSNVLPIIAEEDNNASAGLYKKTLAKISRGLNSILIKMKERHKVNDKEIEEFFNQNLMCLISKSKSIEESIHKVKLSLLSPGADKSLRRTSPGLSLLRVGAFSTARAWWSSDGKKRILYREKLIEMVAESDGAYNEMVAFPKKDSYNQAMRYMGKFGVPSRRESKKIKTSKRFSLDPGTFTFSSGFQDVVKAVWDPDNELNVDKYDIEKMMSYNPVIKYTIEETIKECKRYNIKPAQLLNSLRGAFNKMNSGFMEIFAFGCSTSSLERTIETIQSDNQHNGVLMDMPSCTANEDSSEYEITREGVEDKLSCIMLLYNVICLYNMSKVNSGTLDSIIDSIFLGRESLLMAVRRQLLFLNRKYNLNPMHKKAINIASTYICSKDPTFQTRYYDIMKITKQVCMVWITTQSFTGDTDDDYETHDPKYWSGDYEACFSYMEEVINVSGNDEGMNMTTDDVFDYRDFSFLVRFISKYFGSPPGQIHQKLLGKPTWRDRSVGLYTDYNGVDVYFKEHKKKGNLLELKISFRRAEEGVNLLRSTKNVFNLRFDAKRSKLLCEYESPYNKKGKRVKKDNKSKKVILDSCRTFYYTLSGMQFSEDISIRGSQKTYVNGVSIKNLLCRDNLIFSSMYFNPWERIQNNDMFNYLEENVLVEDTCLTKTQKLMEDILNYEGYSRMLSKEYEADMYIEDEEEVKVADIRPRSNYRRMSAYISADYDDAIDETFGIAVDVQDAGFAELVTNDEDEESKIQEEGPKVEIKEKAFSAWDMSLDDVTFDDVIEFDGDFTSFGNPFGDLEDEDYEGLEIPERARKFNSRYINQAIGKNIRKLRESICNRLLNQEDRFYLDVPRIAGMLIYLFNVRRGFENTRFEGLYKDLITFLMLELKNRKGWSIENITERVNNEIEKYRGDYHPNEVRIQLLESIRFKLGTRGAYGEDSSRKELLF